MPELSPSNVLEAIYTRFVRSEESIFFGDDPDQLHIDLKRKYLRARSIDDAGFLIVDANNMLVAEGGSSSLSIAQDNTGREKTDEILSKLSPIK